MSAPVICAENITMRFNLSREKTDTIKEHLLRRAMGKIQVDEFFALRDINFQVEEGDALALVGRNGSGKSTMLKIIAGVMSPTMGKISVKSDIAPLIELGAGFDFDLTARENIFLNGAVLGYNHEHMRKKFDEIVDFSDLEAFLDVPVKNYSSGMIARLGFSIATAVPAKILIVDEILSVGDEAFRQKCNSRIEYLLKNGTTLLLVSHSKRDVRKICKRAIWLDHGNLLMDDTTDKVVDAYVTATT